MLRSVQITENFAGAYMREHLGVCNRIDPSVQLLVEGVTPGSPAIGAMQSTKYWSGDWQHTATIFSMENADESSFTAGSIPLASRSRGGRSELTRCLKLAVVQDGVDNLGV